MEYKLLEKQLTAKDFIRLKVETGFRDRPIDQVEKALENDLFDVVALVDGEVIGMGRLVGDGVLYWYLQEIIVLPAFQSRGIGTDIVKRLLQHIVEVTPPRNIYKRGTYGSGSKTRLL